VNGPAGALAYYSFLKKFILKVSSAMLMKHFLCDDVGGKHNVCEMKTLKQHNNVLINSLVFTKKVLKFIITSFSF